MQKSIYEKKRILKLKFKEKEKKLVNYYKWLFSIVLYYKNKTTIYKLRVIF